MKTIKSVYKIGNVPSSSHTVGPYHAAQTFGGRYPQADAFRTGKDMDEKYRETSHGGLAQIYNAN